MLTFYFLGQRLQNTGLDRKVKAIADKVEVFQNRLAGRTYKDITRSVDQIDKITYFWTARCYLLDRINILQSYLMRPSGVLEEELDL